GATEAEREGLPVMLGDSTKQRTLMLAGAARAKMLVIPDDDPATARRITAELESVVQLFEDVMRGYELSPDEIQMHEDAIRGGRYAALRAPELPERPAAQGALAPHSLDRRHAVG